MAKLIAEIGINHLGNVQKLSRMIQDLAACKIDSCKLQYRSSKNFFHSSLEMGSTLVSQELDNVNLTQNETVKAIQLARKLNIEVGVSFFRLSDAEDLLSVASPDYFKVPSAEALNFDLIKFLQDQKKPVYVSTGGLTKSQLQDLASAVVFKSNDCVMYCVANYPVALGSSFPLFIDEYREMFDCQIGYSSHDANWEVNVAFLARGVDIIERHFAESKSDEGLDISTSSDLAEMRKLQDYCNLTVWKTPTSLVNKAPNQGEVQNLKDLGSGYYFKRNFPAGHRLEISELDIKSPCRGIRVGSLRHPIRLKRPAKSGEALSISHFSRAVELPVGLIHQCDLGQISLPVRLHDFLEIDKCFGLKNYEWHLSFSEVLLAEDAILGSYKKQVKAKKFSIHLPDYVSSNCLMDPLSNNEDARILSNSLINSVGQLASKLQDLTGSRVPIVGSFSVMSENKEMFYGDLSDRIHEFFEAYDVKLHPQFLPKIAWYFGGSVELDVFCNIEDIRFFNELPFGICLDSAHCIMAANFFQKNPDEWLKSLIPLAQHIHISDALRSDGEGVPFGQGEIGTALDLLLKVRVQKVVEQWEGHLNNFSGFKEALLFVGRHIS